MSVLLSSQGDVAVITLNRPQAMNALNAGMITKIGELIDEVAASASVPRALMFVGAGGKAFCAGADIKELQGIVGEGHLAARKGQLAFAKLDALPFPSVAVVQGVALGGGLELAMACTFRIASLNARLGLPEVKLGVIPGYGGTQRLPRLVGPARALEIIASGRLVKAEEAQHIGLVHQIVDIDEPIEAGLHFLAGFGDRFPASINLARRAVESAISVPLAEGLESEASLFAAAIQTADAQEGMRAFLEKRKPRFIGR